MENQADETKDTGKNFLTFQVAVIERYEEAEPKQLLAGRDYPQYLLPNLLNMSIILCLVVHSISF